VLPLALILTFAMGDQPESSGLTAAPKSLQNQANSTQNSLGTAADPTAIGLAKLEAGQSYIYTGKTVDKSDRVGKKYQHSYQVEVLLFALSGKEFILQTSITPEPEPTIKNASHTVSGIKPQDLKPAFQVDFLKIGENNTLQILNILPSSPVKLDKSKYSSLPDINVDGPVYSETAPFAGMLSNKWKKHPDDLWNGSAVNDFTALETTAGFDDLRLAVAGWRKQERVYVSPIDGMPRVYKRLIAHREGKDIIATIETTITMKPPLPMVDVVAIRQYRRDAEMATTVIRELEKAKTQPRTVELLREKVSRYLADQTNVTPFRVALESLR
jgi:hypothetical protein